MSQDRDASGDPTAPPAFHEAFEPTAASLLDLWMSISDSRGALERSVQVLRRKNEKNESPTLAAMETELERMDALIFESMEKADDLFTLIRGDLSARKAAADASGRKMTGTALVDELDAYLDGAFDRLERPLRLSTGTQTDPIEERTESSVASLYAVQKDASSIEVFDLLSRRVHNMKLDTKAEVSSAAMASPRKWSKKSHSKKSKRRVASPSQQISDSERSMDSGSMEEVKTKRRRSTSQIKGRHPQRVCGVRTNNGEEEYGIEYEGVNHLTWVTIHTATKRVNAMIQEYIQARQKNVKATASAAQQVSGGDAGGVQLFDESEESEPEQLYIVDKIVGHRTRHGKKEYYVKWEGYDSDENTWEPASKLRREVRDVVDDYEREVAEKASRKEAKAQELMRTKAAMQAKVHELTSKMLKEPSSHYPAKRLPKEIWSGKAIGASSDDEDDEGSDDSDSDLEFSSSEDQF